MQWNDFQSNVTSAFTEFRTRNNFQDVTLVSDDQKQILAHRVVLSANSGYFNNVLSQNSHSHPLLCLDGINFSELNNVLDFVYTGKIQQYQEDVDRFIHLAQRLQLKGLLNSQEHKHKEKIEDAISNEAKIEESDSMNHTLQNSKDFQSVEELDSYNVKQIMRTENKKIISMNSEDFQSIEDLDSYIDQQIIRTNEGHECKICNKTSRNRAHIKEHLDTHINGLSFDCSYCGKTLCSRNSLRLHKSKSCKNRIL